MPTPTWCASRCRGESRPPRSSNCGSCPTKCPTTTIPSLCTRRVLAVRAGVRGDAMRRLSYISASFPSDFLTRIEFDRPVTSFKHRMRDKMLEIVVFKSRLRERQPGRLGPARRRRRAGGRRFRKRPMTTNLREADPRFAADPRDRTARVSAAVEPRIVQARARAAVLAHHGGRSRCRPQTESLACRRVFCADGSSRMSATSSMSPYIPSFGAVVSGWC